LPFGIKPFDFAERAPVSALHFAQKKRKTGKAELAFPLSKRDDEARWKKLELEPDAKLHLAWIVSLRGNRSPPARIGRVEAACRAARIVELNVIEDVHEHYLEAGANPLEDFEFLANLKVHIPIRQAAAGSNALISGVETENWRPSEIEYRRGILKDIQAAVGVMNGGAGTWPVKWHCSLVKKPLPSAEP